MPVMHGAQGDGLRAGRDGVRRGRRRRSCPVRPDGHRQVARDRQPGRRRLRARRRPPHRRQRSSPPTTTRSSTASACSPATTGIFTETAGGVTTAVLRQAGRAGRDRRRARRVVAYITGDGLKTIDAVVPVGGDDRRPGRHRRRRRGARAARRHLMADCSTTRAGRLRGHRRSWARRSTGPSRAPATGPRRTWPTTGASWPTRSATPGWSRRTAHVVGYATFQDDGEGRFQADGYVHPERFGRGIGSLHRRAHRARAPPSSSRS